MQGFGLPPLDALAWNKCMTESLAVLDQEP